MSRPTPPTYKTRNLPSYNKALILASNARPSSMRARERVYVSRLSAAGKLRDTARSHPVAVGAGLAVLGAALACAFPMTDTENDLMGDARDDLVRKAKTAVRDEVVQASDLARTLSRAFGSDLERAGQVFRPSRSTVHQAEWR